MCHESGCVRVSGTTSTAGGFLSIPAQTRTTARHTQTGGQPDWTGGDSGGGLDQEDEEETQPCKVGTNTNKKQIL